MAETQQPDVADHPTGNHRLLQRPAVHLPAQILQKPDGAEGSFNPYRHGGRAMQPQKWPVRATFLATANAPLDRGASRSIQDGSTFLRWEQELPRKSGKLRVHTTAEHKASTEWVSLPPQLATILLKLVIDKAATIMAEHSGPMLIGSPPKGQFQFTLGDTAQWQILVERPAG